MVTNTILPDPLSYFCIGYFVQQTSFQSVVSGKQRMFKKSRFTHSNLFHHIFRSPVWLRGHRINLFNIQLVKCMFQAFLRSFGSKSLIPGIFRQPPSNINAGGKIRYEGLLRQSNKANKCTIYEAIDSIIKESLFVKLQLHAFNKSEGFGMVLKDRKSEVKGKGVSVRVKL